MKPYPFIYYIHVALLTGVKTWKQLVNISVIIFTYVSTV